MKHAVQKKPFHVKTILTILSIVLVLGCVIGGTFAWLIDQTVEVENIFTYGDININLAETTGTNYKMIPGADIAKDPVVTVETGSEACWLFVKVEKSSNFDEYMTYAIDTGWTLLSSADNVYYIEVGDTLNATQPSRFPVLANNKVTVHETVNKTMMESIKGDLSLHPTLTFTAYAVQHQGFDTAADAWAKISTGTNP